MFWNKKDKIKKNKQNKEYFYMFNCDNCGTRLVCWIPFGVTIKKYKQDTPKEFVCNACGCKTKL